MTTPQPTPAPTTSGGLPALAAGVRAVPSSVIRDLLALTERPGVISFAGGLPAPELFDVEGARASFDAVLAEAGPRALQYSPTEGNRALRDAVAARYTERGLPTDGADVVITTGSQQGLNLLATALVDPGDVVLVESPSYLAALQCFALAGAKLVAVPSGEDGVDVDALAALADRWAPKLLYTVPTFQNPTGRTLDLANRQSVVAVAERHGFRVLEDDPYAELRYSGDPVLPMAALTGPGRVVSTGSFSKILAPGLRLGWATGSPEVVERLSLLKLAADTQSSTLNMAATAAYLESYDVEAHLARALPVYRHKRDLMLETMDATFPEAVHRTRPEGGLFVWLRYPEDFDATRFLAEVLLPEERVAYVPGATFFPVTQRPNHARVSYSGVPDERLVDGITRWGKLLQREL